MTMDPRPASPTLGAPPRIRPARDEDVDPIDVPTRPATEPVVQPVATAPAAPAAVEPTVSNQAAKPSDEQDVPTVPRRTKKHEVVVQFGTRMSIHARDTLDEIAISEGLSLRHAVEKAIDYYHNRPK